MRWKGFRKVRKQVCKRITHRLQQLQLPDVGSYQDYLEQNPLEWGILDSYCQITITQFFRDKFIFHQLTQKILPELAQIALKKGESRISGWSIGCTSGEEPYTISILWHYLFDKDYPGLQLEILATDTNPYLLERARRACYPASSIRNLPSGIKSCSFTVENHEYCLKPEFKKAVKFLQQDIRKNMPEGPFQFILCRNLVFTYFEEHLQQSLLKELWLRLVPEGWLITGTHEKLPVNHYGFSTPIKRQGLYQKIV